MLMYSEPLAPAKTMVANELAIFDVEKMTLTPVVGLPATDTISGFGNAPYSENGKVYVAVTVQNDYPTIYVINSETAEAQKGLSVEATKLGGIGRLSPIN
jgi:hypothetical protein